MNYSKYQYFFIIFIIINQIFESSVFASNANYISLSNDIARSKHLQIISNNIANTNTIGFEEDDVLFQQVDHNIKHKENNAFVIAESSWRNRNLGPLKMTNRNLDVAIIGDGYFKVMTPQGPRYTLNGNMSISADNILVNGDGMVFLSIDNAEIMLPIGVNHIQVNQNGIIHADDEEIAQIGVFTFVDYNALLKQGDSLYISTIADVAAIDYTVLGGALRDSNVNNIKTMANMMELQRSIEATRQLSGSLSEIDKNLITKIIK